MKRAREILSGARRTDPACREELKAIVDDLPGGALKGDALAVIGAHLLKARDFEQAGAVLTRALGHVWSTGLKAEQITCLNLSTICVHQGRRFEGLVLARRARRLCTESGARYACVAALRTIAMALHELGDMPRFIETIREAETLFDSLDPGDRKQCRMSIASIRHVAARIRGEYEAALEIVSEADLGGHTQYVKEVEALVHLRAGRYREAESCADESVAAAGPDRSLVTRLVVIRLRAALGAGDAERARKLGDSLLDALRGSGEHGLAPALRMLQTEELGTLFAEEFQDPDGARRAYGLAGIAAIERSHELDGFLERFPALRRDEDVLEIIREYRTRFLREHHELLAAVRRILSKPADGPAPIPPGTLVALCAWCHRVRGPDLVWMTLPEFSLPQGARTVSHGICDDCLEDERDSLRRRRHARGDSRTSLRPDPPRG